MRNKFTNESAVLFRFLKSMECEEVNIVNFILRENGASQTVIARKIGKSRAAVNLVIAGKKRSKEIEDEISKIFGFTWEPPSA